MKTFRYKAKDGPDRMIEGKIAAQSAEDAVVRLGEKGFTATEVVEEAGSKGRGSRSWRKLFGVGHKDLVAFTSQLATLIKSGIPILKALTVLAGQTRDTYFKSVINAVSDKVKDGEQLSSSISAYPKIFSPFYRAMVKSGEDNGALDESLTRVSSYYVRQAQLVSKVRAAMVYPVLILVVGMLTLLFVFTNVMPRIIPFILKLNTELPLPTRMLITTSSFLRHNWFWIMLGVGLFGLIFFRAFKNEKFKSNISALKLRIPVFGDLLFKSEISRFTRALEMALRNGMPIVNAVGISLPIINEGAISDKLARGLKELESGKPLSGIFEESGVFSSFAVNLVNVGEESGNLTGALADISESFETDCENAVEVMISLLEPLMVLVIGLVVAFIVSAVLLPIFQMNFVQT